MKKLPISFYTRKATVVAKNLLGKLLVHQTKAGLTSGMIVETEAYIGAYDKACHAYHNHSARTDIMFHPGGIAYVYLIYGMYSCFNVVTGLAGQGDAVLIRALEPVDGLDLMQKRRGRQKNFINLTNGPGKLCQAMDITRELYGAKLQSTKLYLAEYRKIPRSQILISPRRNIDYAEEAKDFLWRFYVKNNPYVSK